MIVGFVVGAVFLPNVACATITFVAPTFSLPRSNLTQTGTFDVYVASTTSPQPKVGDFHFTLDLPNQQNAIFTGGTATSSAAHPYLFGNAQTPTTKLSNSGDTIEGTDFTFTSGGVTLFDGAGLMKVSYSIAPNAIGTFPLVFKTGASASSLDDGQLNPLPLTFLNGSLTVVPEPNAATLLILGVVAAIGYRVAGRGLRRCVDSASHAPSRCMPIAVEIRGS